MDDLPDKDLQQVLDDHEFPDEATERIVRGTLKLQFEYDDAAARREAVQRLVENTVEEMMEQ